MLIVSQDKLKTTQRLEFYIQENYSTDEGFQYEIRSVGGGSFGGYKTEKRAKEVLQEIIKGYTDFNYLKSFPTNITKSVEQFMHKKYSYFDVYEMPKE